MKLSTEDINEHKKTNPGFLFYRSDVEEKITEWCSSCAGEVDILNIPEKQICPECGADIWPCIMCDHNKVNCAKCPIK